MTKRPSMACALCDPTGWLFQAVGSQIRAVGFDQTAGPVEDEPKAPRFRRFASVTSRISTRSAWISLPAHEQLIRTHQQIRRVKAPGVTFPGAVGVYEDHRRL